MIGAIVVNENNLVIHVFGDSLFRETISGSDLSSAPSTSSGIFSDRKSAFIELNVEKPDFVYQEIDHNEVLQIFLPLILLYRTMQEKNVDSYESIVMDKLQILFKESNSYLVIGIADDAMNPVKVQKFMVDVDGVLGFHYGPMIKLVKADFPSIRKIRSKVERRIQYLMMEYTTNSANAPKLFSTDLSIVHHVITQNQQMFKDLMAIPHQLQVYVGTCRCFFLKGGQLIATGNATPNSVPTINRFTPADHRNIVDFVRLSMELSKTRRATMEQVWLQLRPDGQRQIVNLFAVPISDDIDMVCISSVNGSGLIEQLCTVLGILDAVKPGALLAEKLFEISLQLEKFSLNLRNLLPNVNEVAASGGLSQFTFLRDTNRSAALIENLWSRLLSQIGQQEPGCQPQITPPKGNSLIKKLRESSSSLSNRWGSSNSLHSSSASSVRFRAIRNTGFSIHIDALISHFQRQLHNIMSELCSQAFYVAYNYKFDTLVKNVRRIASSMCTHVSQLTVPSNYIQRFNPLHLGFDMKAYIFLSLDTRLSFLFCNDREWRVLVGNVDRVVFKRRIRKVKLQEKEFLLVEMSNALEYRSTQTTVVDRLRKLLTRETKPPSKSFYSLPTPLFCAFLFDSFVNFNLAYSQSNQLSLILYEKLLAAQNGLK